MENHNGERKIFSGDWNCSKCNKAISELPFEPRETGNLLCLDCFKEGRAGRPDRQMFEGNWQCSGCSTAITQLPFEPRETGNLLCRDCHMKSKA